MRLAALLMASALYGADPPGLVTVRAGALNCGAVMRAVDQVQNYCFGPGNVLVQNTIQTANKQLFVVYDWCINVSGCTYTTVSWWFKVLSTGGIAYEYSVNSAPVVAGTLTGVYGTTGCLPTKIPWTGVATNVDGDKVPAMIGFGGSAKGHAQMNLLCWNWWQRNKTSGGWDPQNQCGAAVTNLFQVCSGVLAPLQVE